MRFGQASIGVYRREWCTARRSCQHPISFKSSTVGCGLEQKTVYFLMIPFTLRGGSQETNTTEFEADAALTPAGGPGTVGERIYSYFFSYMISINSMFALLYILHEAAKFIFLVHLLSLLWFNFFLLFCFFPLTFNKYHVRLNFD